MKTYKFQSLIGNKGLSMQALEVCKRSFNPL